MLYTLQNILTNIQICQILNSLSFTSVDTNLNVNKNLSGVYPWEYKLPRQANICSWKIRGTFPWVYSEKIPDEIPVNIPK